MPWKNLTPMDEIIRLVSLATSGRFTITDLCEQFTISRKTAYKYLDRYAEGGGAALAPRSHRPQGCPQRTGGWKNANDVRSLKKHHAGDCISTS